MPIRFIVFVTFYFLCMLFRKQLISVTYKGIVELYVYCQFSFVLLFSSLG